MSDDAIDSFFFVPIVNRIVEQKVTQLRERLMSTLFGSILVAGVGFVFATIEEASESDSYAA